MKKNIGKIIYSEGYGFGIYSAGYKKLATYFPLIEWLEKYYTNEETLEELLKLYTNIHNNYDINNKNILELNLNDIKEEKIKELVNILQNFLKKNPDTYLGGLLNGNLKIEEIYPNEIFKINDYDGYEEIVYDLNKDGEIVIYENIIKLNNLHKKTYYLIKEKKLIKALNIDKVYEKYGKDINFIEIEDNKEIIL